MYIDNTASLWAGRQECRKAHPEGGGDPGAQNWSSGADAIKVTQYQEDVCGASGDLQKE